MIYFEDMVVGQTRTTGSKTVSREEIIDFAREYDPQPFHIDEEAARHSVFGGLVASGWHTAGIMMRLLVESFIGEAVALGSPGFDDLKWLKPVRPADRLTVRSTCTEKTPSRSKPWMGSCRFHTEVLNQHGEVVLSVYNIGLYRRRDAGPSEGGDS